MIYETVPISSEALKRALALRDLTDPGQGRHAMQALIDSAAGALCSAWRCRAVVHRAPPLTTVADNYDRLHYPAEAVSRDARYTRYVTEYTLLRTHTSAMIPPLLRALGCSRIDDVLLVCPGLVYRRDSIDRLHTGEPHQVDLWRLRAGRILTMTDLTEMIGCVIAAMLPGKAWRASETEHPYTLEGRQVDVEVGGKWIEVAECGLASPAVLRDAGLAEEVTGLAMGIGLDRMLMLRKDIDDIRLLRVGDPRIATQMVELSKYRPISRQPAIVRDLSIAVDAAVTAEDLGDRVRSALGERAGDVEQVLVGSETAYSELPIAARERLGIAAGQKNVLLRVVLRALERSLTHEEANRLRDDVYAAVHEGAVRTYIDAARKE